jgi:hypothetical protein
MRPERQSSPQDGGSVSTALRSKVFHGLGTLLRHSICADRLIHGELSVRANETG